MSARDVDAARRAWVSQAKRTARELAADRGEAALAVATAAHEALALGASARAVLDGLLRGLTEAAERDPDTDRDG